MDSISLKHIKNGKLQVSIVILLAVFTILSALFALGIGSSENLDFFTTVKFIFGFEEPRDLQSAII